MDFNRLCNEVLSLIEIEETQLLNWGFIEVHVDLDRRLSTLLQRLPARWAHVWQEAQSSGRTERDILDNLVERGLIFPSSAGYRSRYAETVRLLFLLRQRFSSKDWQSAPSLVSDYRLQLNRRSYPRYRIPRDELIGDLNSLAGSTLIREAVEALLVDDIGHPLQLAQFQRDAIVQLFRDLNARQDRAMAIGAGTGSGKTKAFYVPALAHIAQELERDTSYTQGLAIYPRTELLKDQLAETFREARKLDELLERHDKRPIRIAAYYGDTPRDAKAFESAYPPSNWIRANNHVDWLCPYFSCPQPECNQADMVWRQHDIRLEIAANDQGRYGQHARLSCVRCGYSVGPEKLLLTREQMRRTLPEILFTTTEMLNRRLANGKEHALFGIACKQPPRLVLLDEIHTYEGIPGAQVAYLLRRWRQARGEGTPATNVCFVGLSATLQDAETFIANLTGIPRKNDNINYIEPQPEELIAEGMEYNIVLKGDPVSGASLLATSVQTAMLLTRMLDNSERQLSGGVFGTKTFAFTDALDVINRWYYIQHDAEQIKRLSRLRASEGLLDDELRRRHLQGQVWQVSERLGHELDLALRLGRTSSQDRGINPDAELVIATSTLEVGYNDRQVGAVIQHKAPRSAASFLQRKGRAGRRRQMRPWTVVVASAYGRDRWAFQHAESLFDPLLQPLALPLQNDYVLKIQAAFALVDWLTLGCSATHRGADVWNALGSEGQQRSGRMATLRQTIATRLRAVLAGEEEAELQGYVARALGLDADDPALRRIFWHEPRALMHTVIPTVLRQLETEWRHVGGEGDGRWQDRTARRPLPDFLPSTLWNDLNLPEVEIVLPRQYEDDEAEDARSLDMTQALFEFAPGRANKRYVLTQYEDVAHWLEVPEGADRVTLDQLAIRFHPLPRSVSVGQRPYRLFQPQALHLSTIPTHVRSTSYGRLRWQARFQPHAPTALDVGGDQPGAPGRPLTLSDDARWRRLVDDVRLYAAGDGLWVEVTRLAHEVELDTRYDDGSSQRRLVAFVDDQNADAAIGFTLAVDALRFRLVVPDVAAIVDGDAWPQLYAGLAAHYFNHRLQQDDRLNDLSTFEIDWLWQLEMSMIVAVAVSRQVATVAAAAEVRPKRAPLAERTLDVIFQSSAIDEDDAARAGGRLRGRLLALLDDKAINAALDEWQTVLWQPEREPLLAWLRDCYRFSVGSTLLTTLEQLLPEINAGDLLMDVDGNVVWISETAIGGIGLVTRLAAAIAEHPRRFDLLLRDTLQHCERAHLAQQLNDVSRLLQADGQPTVGQPMQAEFAKLRATQDLPTVLDSRARLARLLDEHGILASRRLFVELNGKFLRPNSGPDTDALIAAFADLWRTEEQRLGLHIDLRVMSVAGYRVPHIEARVAGVLGRIGGIGMIEDENQVFNLLQSLLWLDCRDSCPNCIQTWNPYQDQVFPSRALLSHIVNPQGQPVMFGDGYYLDELSHRLRDAYQAVLACRREDVPACKEMLLQVLMTPVEIGYQVYHPVLERVGREGPLWHFALVIEELAGL